MHPPHFSLLIDSGDTNLDILLSSYSGSNDLVDLRLRPLRPAQVDTSVPAELLLTSPWADVSG